jgi:acetolactate synthase I/II/III large subunit
MTVDRNGAYAICAALRNAGVELVFGVPGTQTIPLYEALRKSGVRTVTATHELAATFMAQGHFRASGRLAVVSAIPGPGFSFALAAVPEARLDSAALVLLTGRPPVCALGRRRSQSIDQAAMAGPVVKDIIDIIEADQAAEAVQRACAVALSDEPGPVLVQVATDVYGQAIGESDPSALVDSPNSCVDHEALRAAIDFVLAANRPLFYVGQGAADAAQELKRAADELGALVATTPSGRGVLPEDDDRLLPLDATGDLAAFNAVAAESDAIVVLGAALAENGSIGFGLELPTEKLVRVDVSNEVLATPPIARVSLKTSARAFLIALLQAIERAAPQAQQRGLDSNAARAQRSRLQDRRTGGPSDGRIGASDARAFFAATQSALPADACLVLDSGMHQLLARRHVVIKQPRGLLFPTDFQSMAFGLPAAIGAKLAQPERAVVALIGDGGFLMTGLELRTAVRLGLSLPVIVFDDQSLGLIRLDQLLSSGNPHATDIGSLDYEAMAEAVGCAFESATTNDIEQHLRTALQRRGPTLIVVPVSDAPALTRMRQKRALSRTVKKLLGPKIVGLISRLRSR